MMRITQVFGRWWDLTALPSALAEVVDQEFSDRRFALCLMRASHELEQILPEVDEKVMEQFIGTYLSCRIRCRDCEDGPSQKAAASTLDYIEGKLLERITQYSVDVQEKLFNRLVTEERVWTLIEKTFDDENLRSLQRSCLDFFWHRRVIDVSERGSLRLPLTLYNVVDAQALDFVFILADRSGQSPVRIKGLQSMGNVDPAWKAFFRFSRVEKQLREICHSELQGGPFGWEVLFRRTFQQWLEKEFGWAFSQRFLPLFGPEIREATRKMAASGRRKGWELWRSEWCHFRQMARQCHVRCEVAQQYEKEGRKEALYEPFRPERRIKSWEIQLKADFIKAKLYTHAGTWKSMGEVSEPLEPTQREVIFFDDMTWSGKEADPEMVFKMSPSYLMPEDIKEVFYRSAFMVLNAVHKVVDLRREGGEIERSQRAYRIWNTLTFALHYEKEMLKAHFLMSKSLWKVIKGFQESLARIASKFQDTLLNGKNVDATLKDCEYRCLAMTQFALEHATQAEGLEELAAQVKQEYRRRTRRFVTQERLSNIPFRLCGVEGRPENGPATRTFKNVLGVIHRRYGHEERFIKEGVNLEEVILRPTHETEAFFASLNASQVQKVLVMQMLLGNMDGHICNCLVREGKLFVFDMEMILSHNKNINASGTAPNFRCFGMAFPTAQVPIETVVLEEIVYKWPWEQVFCRMDEELVVSCREKRPFDLSVQICRGHWFESRAQKLRKMAERELQRRFAGKKEKLTLRQVAFSLFPRYRKQWKRLKKKEYPDYFVAHWCGVFTDDILDIMPTYDGKCHEMLAAKGYPEGWIQTLLVNPQYIEKDLGNLPQFEVGSDPVALTQSLVKQGFLNSEMISLVDEHLLFPDEVLGDVVL